MIIDFLSASLAETAGHCHPREEEGRGEAGSSQVSLDLRKADLQRGFYARHLVSTVPRLAVGAIQGMGPQKPCPYPQCRAGAMTPNLAAEKRKQKGGATGRPPPRSSEKRRKSLKALIQGAKGSLSSMQPGRGDTLFPRAMDIA